MIDNHSSERGRHPHLAVIADAPLIAGFFLLLQQGVLIRRRVGCSVEAFLRQEVGATAETIERIQSVMLDGKPVDDIATAIIHDGAVLALSAAMPGLVGATLRRAGAYSSFRGAITYHETGGACARGAGWVKIKIFNLLMAELGPGLLRKGVLLGKPDLFDFLSGRAEGLRQGCICTLDGRPVDAAQLRGDLGKVGADSVLLTVTSGQDAD